MKTVTQTDRTAAERQRRRRERQRAEAGAQAPLLFERYDWQLFLRPETLPQKAGCEPSQISRVVLKEIVDNALDTGSDDVTIEPITGGYRITDRGPGIDPADIAKFFAVNRPLLSSKLKRLPLRGMLGNGLRVVMGAVAAYNGTITVISRGYRQTLAIDKITGETRTEARYVRPDGKTKVEIMLPIFTGQEKSFAELSLKVAYDGTQYDGPSRPQWYAPEDLRELFARVTPPTITVARFAREVFELKVDDDRIAASLAADDVAALYDWLCALAGGRRVPQIGFIGNDADVPYHKVDSVARIGGAIIPFCVEAWVQCRRAERGDNAMYAVDLLLNRSPSTASLWVSAGSDGLFLRGCGLSTIAPGKRAEYDILLSLITPHVRLMNDGKTPFLADFREAIRSVVQKAARSAYNAMIRPPKNMSRAEAARQVMPEAYLKASANDTLPANARQIMYAARPDILRLAEVEDFDDDQFTQHWLPDYVMAHPEECANWNVAYDPRGQITEPHTRRAVPLGTLQVREYLAKRAPIGPAVTFDIDTRYPTEGPENRYGDVLYVEKEGFDSLIEAARIAERFDIAPMSNKGMSVVAGRRLLDGLASLIKGRVLVLHDFDISGFTIAGTLTSDGRRYIFKNAVKMVDLGLRLADVRDLGLQFEPVPLKKRRRDEEDDDPGESLEAQEATLRRHGAKEDEIEFLLSNKDGKRDGRQGKRVELNAMTSDVFVAFLERKLTEAVVKKVVPSGEIMRQHARRLVEQQLTKEALDDMRDELAEKADAYKLPRDLAAKVRKLLAERPELPWDDAVALALGISESE